MPSSFVRLGDSVGLVVFLRIRGRSSARTQARDHEADYNRDGRPDLVVTQNGASTHLYQNVQGNPGLRVRLNAGPANPTGVGAIARLIFADEKKGPAKIVTAGSGYWSQDSATLIFARPTVPIKIEVQWPHGKIITTAIPASEDESEVTPHGTLIKPGN